MVFLFFLMVSLVTLETVYEWIASAVRRATYPRCRWNRGGRYTFN